MSTRPLTNWLTAAGLAAGLVLGAPAHAVEYRSLTTSDGQTFACEIVATESKGLRVRVPAGEMLVPFTALRNIVPIEASAYDSADPWLVLVPEESPFRSELLESISHLPAVVVVGEPGAPEVLDDAAQIDVPVCRTDLGCLASATSTGPWMWLIVAEDDGTVRGMLNTTSRSEAVTPASLEPGPLLLAVSEVMGLVPDDDIIESAGGSGTQTGPSPDSVPVDLDARKVRRLSLVPLPGYPSLKQRDTGGFAMAMGVVLPSTALWVGAVGSGSQSRVETALIGVSGFYVLTIAANQVLGLRSLEANAAVVELTADED